MRLSGTHDLHGSPEQVWAALLDPRTLVRTIPGCERLVATGENAYDMTVTAGVAAVKGTYAGTCRLSDLDPHSSLVLRLDGAGAPGTIGATVAVSFADAGEELTRISYDADAVVGGMVGGVGQRMLTSVSRRMAAEFFGNVDAVLTGSVPAPGTPEVGGMSAEASRPSVEASGGGGSADRPTPAFAGAAPGSAPGDGYAGPAAVGEVFTRPPGPPGTGGLATPRDFLAGVAVGAGLVALGVVLGAVCGRRG